MQKTVLITGASRGIGAACARRFAAAGFAVIVHYHKSKEAAESVCRDIIALGGTAQAIGANLADPAQISELVQKARSCFGSIDVLGNNAGIALNKMLCDTTTEEWDDIFAVNLRAMMLVTKEIMPDMVHKKEGSIINLSSIWGITGASCEVAYSAAKAGVIGFTKALAKELGPSGILVNCVAPGVIETDMNAALAEETRQALAEETPLGKLGAPEDIAEAVFFLASGANRFITGQVLSPNGGIVI